MKALLQRVSQASVSVQGSCVGNIDAGVLVLLGMAKGDTEKTALSLIEKTLAYRMFSDDEGRMNRSVVESGGGVLLVSQFTLCADTQKGLRPSFSSALEPDQALRLYDFTLRELSARHDHVAAGVFGANMSVALVNDGPVTFMLEA